MNTFLLWKNLAVADCGRNSYVAKESDPEWEEGDEISILEFKTTEYGTSKKVIASEGTKRKIPELGINKCARESGFDRKNFIRKLIREIPVKRNSYNEFVCAGCDVARLSMLGNE